MIKAKRRPKFFYVQQIVVFDHTIFDDEEIKLCSQQRYSDAA